MGNLFQELKRRKVFRVAAIYAVVAWLLIQVADVVLPTFGAPSWVNQTIIFLFFLGLPPTLVAAWAYESTPSGILPDAAVQRSPGSVATSAQPINYIILLVVVVMAGIQFGDRISLGGDRGETLRARNVPDGSLSTVLRSSINLDNSLPRSNRGPRIFLDLSSDGRLLYYSHFFSDQNRSPSLMVRDLATGTENRLEVAHRVNVSPDDKKLLISSQQQLKIYDLDGGSSFLLREPVVPSDWLSDDEILLVDEDRVLKRVSATGQTLTELGTINEAIPPNWIRVLPDRNGFLYSTRATTGNNSEFDIKVFDLDTQQSQLVMRNGIYPEYVSTGHLLFVRSNNLMAAPFDFTSRTLMGIESIVIENIEVVGEAAYTVSDTGRLVYLTGGELLSNEGSLLSSDLDGNTTELPIEPADYQHPRTSPDGSKLVLTVVEPSGDQDLWLYDLDRNTLGRRTYAGAASRGVWTPDSQSLVYIASRSGRGEIWKMNADGTGVAEQLYGSSAEAEWVSPIDDTVLFIEGPSGATAINSLSLRDGVWIKQPLIDTPSNEYAPRISPDGRWITYVSNETGQVQAYVRPYPNVQEGKWQISSNIGREPMWSPTGDAIFFIGLDGVLMRAEIHPQGNVFDFDIPVPLFAIRQNTDDPPNYAITSDGQRIIHTSHGSYPPEDPTAVIGNASLTVVENWFVELNNRVPVN